MIRLVISLALTGSLLLNAQSGQFDYQREEMTAMSLNGIPYADARLLTFSGHPFMAPTPLAALLNPAALPRQPRASLSLSHTVRSAFQYWGINEGILASAKAVRQGQFGIGSAALSLPLPFLTLAGGYAETAVRAFPSFIFENIVSDPAFSSRYRYEGLFSGREGTLFLAVCRTLFSRLQLGLTLSRSTTHRKAKTEESWGTRLSPSTPWQNEFNLAQDETHTLSHWTLTTGLLLPLSDRLSAGISLVTPFLGRVERKLERSLTIPQDSRSSEVEATDSFQLPQEIRASAVWRLPVNWRSLTLRSGFDLQLRLWKNHRNTFFGRDRTEALRNTLSTAICLAATLKTTLGIFDFGGAFRLDPQPLVTPETTVRHASFGLSWQDKWLEVDLALAVLTARPGDTNIPHTLLTCSVSAVF
jgi:hypothetical protein